MNEAAAPTVTAIFPFQTAQIGGSHVSTFVLADQLARTMGIRAVLLLTEENEISAEAARLGLEVAFTGERAAARNMPWVDAARVKWRMRTLSAYGPNALIHCNDLGALQGWGMAAKLLGRPLVYHNHALNRMLPPNTTLIRAADKVICVSQACRTAVRFLPGDKVETILNPIGAPPDVDRDQARRRLIFDLGLQGGRRFVGFVGNFWERKRPFFALQAFAAMAARSPDLLLVYFGRAGDITPAQIEAEAVRLGIEGRVALAGFRLPLEQNIAALDLLMMPAVNEPFGRTLIEAALLRTPYVATDDAGHHEIGSRWGGGTLVALQAAPEAFAEAALEALGRSEALLLSPSEHERVVEDFSPSAHARAVLGCYRTIVPRGASQ